MWTGPSNIRAKFWTSPSLAHLLGLSETIQKVRKMQENQERESKGKGELQGGGVLVNRFFRVCIQIPDG